MKGGMGIQLAVQVISPLFVVWEGHVITRSALCWLKATLHGGQIHA
jgi:hypothetical protein